MIKNYFGRKTGELPVGPSRVQTHFLQLFNLGLSIYETFIILNFILRVKTIELSILM